MPTSLESIVTSLDLSRQLKEAGCPQESINFWVSPNRSNNNWHVSIYKGLGDHYSAYAAEEIIGLLPPVDIRTSQDDEGVKFSAVPLPGHFAGRLPMTVSRSLADACGELYLDLKARGWI